MSIEKSVLEKLVKLPVEKQKEVLGFVESLEKKTSLPRRRRSLKGLWAGLGAEVSPEDIAEARREMGEDFLVVMFDGKLGRRYSCRGLVSPEFEPTFAGGAKGDGRMPPMQATWFTYLPFPCFRTLTGTVGVG